jgi:outer membrane biosynthesis protein TonB
MLIHSETPRILTSTMILAFAGLLGACVASAEASTAPAKAGQATVEGGLDKPAVREVVKAHIDEVRGCYNAELVEDENVEGRSVVSFVILADGSASEVGVAESTMPTRFDECMTAAVEGWTFPTSDAETRVVYPFMLSPG